METLLSPCLWLGEGMVLRPVSSGLFPYMHFMLALAACPALQERQAAQDGHCAFPRKTSSRWEPEGGGGQRGPGGAIACALVQEQSYIPGGWPGDYSWKLS